MSLVSTNRNACDARQSGEIHPLLFWANDAAYSTCYLRKISKLIKLKIYPWVIFYFCLFGLWALGITEA